MLPVSSAVIFLLMVGAGENHSDEGGNSQRPPQPPKTRRGPPPARIQPHRWQSVRTDPSGSAIAQKGIDLIRTDSLNPRSTATLQVFDGLTRRFRHISHRSG